MCTSTQTPTDQKKLREEIARLTEEYLAKGNTITELGVTETVCEWANKSEERKIQAKKGAIGNRKAGNY